MAGYGEMWGALDGTEIWNAARTAAYLRNGLAPRGVDVGKCLPCQGVGVAVEEDPAFPGYQLPETDLAPWYDPDAPVSADFAGLMVTEITGLQDSPYTRSVVSTINGGGAFGRLTTNPRVVTVRGLLLGRTCCAIAYGQRWLVSVLTAGVSPCDCGAGSFCFLTCCPEVIDPATCPTDPAREPRPSEQAEYDSFFRTTVDAGMVSGPIVLERIGSSCGCGGCLALEVEFTLAMGPFMFGDPVTCIDNALLTDGTVAPAIGPGDDPPCEPLESLVVCPECGGDIIWVGGGYGGCDGGQDGNCPEAGACFDDPRCPIPAPPPQPPRPISTCEPFPASDFVKITCCDIPATAIRDWSDAVIDLQIFSGSRPLRNVKVSAYPNPLGLSPDNFNDCDACAGFIINYVPCNATLRINGAERTAKMECVGNVEQDAFRNLSAITGMPFDFPVLSCSAWTVCVEVDADQVADNATITIAVVPREA